MKEKIKKLLRHRILNKYSIENLNPIPMKYLN